jgi:hypothetical protein
MTFREFYQAKYCARWPGYESEPWPLVMARVCDAVADWTERSVRHKHSDHLTELLQPETEDPSI